MMNHYQPDNEKDLNDRDDNSRTTIQLVILSAQIMHLQKWALKIPFLLQTGLLYKIFWYYVYWEFVLKKLSECQEFYQLQRNSICEIVTGRNANYILRTVVIYVWLLE